ncbi:MAG: GerAB/ArcD/ProY family transporter [Oscillospiraceae bacterium]
MQQANTGISRYQLFCLIFMGLLSPIIELLPKRPVHLAGGGACYSVLLAFFPLFVLLLIKTRLLKNAAPEEGLGEVVLRVFGKIPGRVLIFIITAWLIFYTAFALRISADRYVVSAYQQATPTIFIVVLLFISTLASLGAFRALGRTAEAFFPLLLLALVVIFALAAQDINYNFIPPLRATEPISLFAGSLPILNVLGLGLYLSFLEGRVEKRGSALKTSLLWLLFLLAVVFFLCLTCVGSFGATAVTRLSRPFFSMIQNISVFSFIERPETLVIALWVITDFVFLATLQFIIAANLRLCFGFPRNTMETGRRRSMKNGRFLLLACALLVFVIAMALPFDSPALSLRLVPGINLCFSFLFLPLTALVGAIRKRI